MSKVVVFDHDWIEGNPVFVEQAVYEGDYIAGLNPANALVISELIPDVGNANDGNPQQVIRAIYNNDSWSKVEIDD